MYAWKYYKEWSIFTHQPPPHFSGKMSWSTYIHQTPLSMEICHEALHPSGPPFPGKMSWNTSPIRPSFFGNMSWSTSPNIPSVSLGGCHEALHPAGPLSLEGCHEALHPSGPLSGKMSWSTSLICPPFVWEDVMKHFTHQALSLSGRMP